MACHGRDQGRRWRGVCGDRPCNDQTDGELGPAGADSGALRWAGHCSGAVRVPAAPMKNPCRKRGARPDGPGRCSNREEVQGTGCPRVRVDVDESIVAVRAGEANVALTDPRSEWPRLHPYDGLGNVGRSSGREAAHAAGDDGNAGDLTPMVRESRPATPDRCSFPRGGAEDQLTQSRDGGPADARLGSTLAGGKGARPSLVGWELTVMNECKQVGT
jgi:hypothetical protein